MTGPWCARCADRGEIAEWVGSWTGTKSHACLGSKISRYVPCPECRPRRSAP